MSACGGNFHRAFHVFLSLHVFEIKQVIIGKCCHDLLIERNGREVFFLFQKSDHFTQMVETVNFKALNHCSLVSILIGQKNTFKTFFFGVYGDGKYPFDRL